MYDNIGGKLKGLATTICVIEVIAAVISGIALMASNEHLAVVGLLIMVIGSIFAWISSWLLYGFGQLIENSDTIAEEYNRKNNSYHKTVATNNDCKQNQRRKNAKNIISNPDVPDDKFIDFQCHECNSELSFTKEQLKNIEGLTCPMCDAHISL